MKGLYNKRSVVVLYMTCMTRIFYFNPSNLGNESLSYTPWPFFACPLTPENKFKIDFDTGSLGPFRLPVDSTQVSIQLLN